VAVAQCKLATVFFLAVRLVVPVYHNGEDKPVLLLPNYEYACTNRQHYEIDDCLEDNREDY